MMQRLQRRWDEWVGPLAGWELTRVSRWRIIYWLRVGVALVPLLVLLAVLDDLRYSRYGHRPEAMSQAAHGAFHVTCGLMIVGAYVLPTLLLGSAISGEREKKTLEFLLVTPLSDQQVVLGKLFGRALPAVVMLLAAVPTLGLCGLFGGIDYGLLAAAGLSSLVGVVFGAAWAMTVSVGAKTGQAGVNGAAFGLFAIFYLMPVLGGMVIGLVGMAVYYTLGQTVFQALVNWPHWQWPLLPLVLLHPLGNATLAMTPPGSIPLLDYGWWAYPLSFPLPIILAYTMLLGIASTLREPLPEETPKADPANGEKTAAGAVPDAPRPADGDPSPVAYPEMPVESAEAQAALTTEASDSNAPPPPAGKTGFWGWLQKEQARQTRAPLFPLETALWFPEVDNPIWQRHRLRSVVLKPGYARWRLAVLGLLILGCVCVIARIMSDNLESLHGMVLGFGMQGYFVTMIFGMSWGTTTFTRDQKNGIVAELLMTPLTGREILNGYACNLLEQAANYLLSVLAVLALVVTICALPPVATVGSLIGGSFALVYVGMLALAATSAAKDGRWLQGTVAWAVVRSLLVLLLAHSLALSWTLLEPLGEATVLYLMPFAWPGLIWVPTDSSLALSGDKLVLGLACHCVAFLVAAFETFRWAVASFDGHVGRATLPARQPTSTPAPSTAVA